jgi:hypothetical protein
MNTIQHQNFREIRFLLHGERDYYDNDESLYVVSQAPQGSSLWETIARRVIPTWRIVPSSLAGMMPTQQWTSLNILELSPENIIAELTPNQITAQDLASASDREKLLGQVALYRHDLWRNLPLHETIDGEFVAITETTYRKNPNFDFNPLLNGIVTLIKDTQRPDLIPEWTPQQALIVVLGQPEPERFCKNILKWIPTNIKDKSSDVLHLLKKLKETPWLTAINKNLKPVTPQSVIFIGDRLKDFVDDLENVLCSSSSNYISSSMLDVKADLDKLKIICEVWYENDALKFLLAETSKNLDYSAQILRLLKIFEDKKQPVSGNEKEGNIKALREVKWLRDRQGRAISPQEIVYLPALIKEAKIIFEKQTIWGYVTPDMLQDGLDIKFCLEESKLQELFITGDRALRCLGEAIGCLPEYYLGDRKIDSDLLEKLVRVLKDCPEVLVLEIANKVSFDKFKSCILASSQRQITDSQLVGILNWISEKHKNKPSSDAILIYEHYLKMLNHNSDILRNIRLLSRSNEWNETRNLTWGEQENIAPEFRLLESHQEVLQKYLDRFEISKIGVTSPEVSNQQTTKNANLYEITKNYFADWDGFCTRELIGIFLYIIHGDNEQVLNLAKDYLGNRNIDFVKENLIGDLSPIKFNIKLLALGQNIVDVISVLGESLSARLVDTQDIGKLRNIFASNNGLDLTILPIKLSTQDNCSREYLQDLLKLSTYRLLHDVYKLDTKSLKCFNDEWDTLASPDQLDIQETRDRLIQDLRWILIHLGVKEKSGQIKKILNNLDTLYDDEAEAKRSKSKKLKTIEDDIQGNNELLAGLFTKNDDDAIEAQVQTLEAVRNKIQQLGYHQSRLPFELFQNADDAVSEWKDMLPPNSSIDEIRKHFVVIEDTEKQDRVSFIHAGRPISCFRHPDNPDIEFRDRGFRRDLRKMLMFNFSDKGEGTTGKFGLGFKSIYLVTAKPFVLSRSLGFSVQGGILPVNLEPEKRSALKGKIESLGLPSDSTIIELPLDANTTSYESLIFDFKKCIGLLLVFSRQIKTCRLINNESSYQEEIKWESSEFMGIAGIEYGQIRILNEQSQWQNYKLLCFNLESGKVAIALPRDLRDTSPLRNMPTFWVTAPTKKSLGFSFVINGDFDITTGRTSLDLISNKNNTLMQQIGEQLGVKLCELFQRSNGNCIHALGLDGIDAYTFWEFLWNVLVVEWLGKNKDIETDKLLYEGLGGEYSGMGLVIASHAALPNGLFGRARQLVRLERVTHFVSGLLAEENIFKDVVAQSNQFLTQYSPDRLVHNSVWQQVKKLLGSARADELSLVEVLNSELGNQQQIPPDVAARLGKIFTQDRLKEWEIKNKSEYNEIAQVLSGSGICFQSERNKEYTAASRLLVRTANSSEEKLIAAFAPSDRLLHSDYMYSGLDFFLVCREQRETVAVEDMVAWAEAADSDEKRQAVREYLGLGERKLVFANALRNSIVGTWMEQDEGIAQILRANSQQSRVEQALRNEISWDDLSNDSIEKDILPRIANQNSVESILRSIYAQWEIEKEQRIRDYIRTTYPNGIELQLSADDDVENNPEKRSNWLTLLFIGAAHTMGYFKAGSHRNFIKLCQSEICQSESWWQTFAKPKPQENPDRWIAILDSYLDSPSDDMEYFHWMKNFVVVYQLSRYLKEYAIDIFCALNRQQQPLDSLNDFLEPKSSNNLESGPVVPSLSKSLGMGAHFIVRELVRTGVIHGSAVKNIIPYCFVPTKNIRRTFYSLGCLDSGDVDKWDDTHSKRIHDFLKSNLEDEQLLLDFDLPFQYIDVTQFF